jgi:hypothetical protein
VISEAKVREMYCEDKGRGNEPRNADSFQKLQKEK